MTDQNKTASDMVAEAEKAWQDLVVNHPDYIAMKERVQKLEDAAAWLDEPQAKDSTAAELADIRNVLLFVATQPWPRDKDTCNTWEALVQHIKDERAKGKPMSFKETLQASEAKRIRAEVMAELAQQNAPVVRDIL